ncbi:hypothetical protein BGW80DRAFT_1385378, partial [Lactifluus volemus]
MIASFTRNSSRVSMLSRLRTALFSAASGSPAWTSSSALGSPLIAVGKAKNFWFKSMPRCPAPVVTAPEDFHIPHIFVTEETKSPLNPIRSRARVQIYRGACTNVPSSTHASMTLEDPDSLETAADDDWYQDQYDILEESDDAWEPGDSEYHAMLVAEEATDDTLSDPGTEKDSASRNEEDQASWRPIVVMDQATFLPQAKVALGRRQALLLSSFARRRQYQLWEHPRRPMMRAGRARLTLR